MNRSLKLSMLMALGLGTSQAMALDLGQIQVKSTLGQPLLAEIPLHPASPAELQSLTVQLASSEDFARAGIQGGRTSIPLHFSVANTGNGQVIRITSSVVVDDPYIDLLLEVNGKAGKSMREFAILLDPPGSQMSAPATAPAPVAATAPTSSAPSQAVQTAVAPTSRQNHPAPVSRAPAPAPAAVANGNYGPVARGQTLSSIARHVMPTGVDVNQMLLALKQANPEAFYRDNINALKTGAVLRVPTSDEAQAMTVAAAVAAVERENGDWRAGATSKPTTVADAATRSSSSSAPTGKSGSAGDRLALVPVKDVNGAGGQSGTSANTGGKSAAGLRQDLLRTQESLATLEQQGNDLTARLKDLTDINNKNEHLLSLKDNEIAQLQGELAKARKAAGLPPVAAPAGAAVSATAPAPATSALAKPVVAASPEAKPAPATNGTVAGAPPIATSSTAMTAAPVAAASAPAVGSASSVVAAAKPVPVKPAHKPVTAHNPPSVDEQPWYMQTWAWAVGAVVALLLLVGLLRRRKPAATSLPKTPSSLADRFESTPPAEHDGDDVDQDELLDELAEHPDDIHLHLELVTLYYSRRDVEHFEAAAEAMHAHITDPQQDEWQDVVHMGEDLVPGHPLFAPHVVLPVHEEVLGSHDFGADDYATVSNTAPVASSMPPLPPQTPRKVSEYKFNFDLSGQMASDAASEHAVVAEQVAEAHHEVSAVAQAEQASGWHFDENEHQVGGQGSELGEYSDDPVDTKLDLARAYLDMGDADGARAMLGEVVKEGSQMQQDVAKRLLETLH
ncbi:FimV/HubP family polar landmark protein [Rhodanobacter sp. MP7CTX1]|uniref:FimV/HubP family polar landmark protein n=1 Tax=Rhodanobacter sp. MP7CTX1 TaxID=2723084 RepID=UPI00161266EC|nr:FimV/HubP family polar landmark protein [Rhodanobacter sp. MP7CTX1]MBB6186714.1 pilus assembly protein FimV [Rhodanobacter sp. MP7CTX1]